MLAAYRFLPELQGYVETIQLAQQIRGIEWNDSLASRLTAPFRLVLPLFSLAARRGEGIACAMESRGLGAVEERTYCVETRVDSSDWLLVAGTVGIYALIAVALVCLGEFHLSFSVYN